MRLTQKRIERWQADVERAGAILRRVEGEARQYRMASKGSRLDHLTRVVAELRIDADVRPTRDALAELAKAEARTHA